MSQNEKRLGWRQDVVAEVRTWIGTPFQHNGRHKGTGVDCARLLIEVYGACDLIPPVDLPRYSKHWFLHTTEELLEEVVRKHCDATSFPLAGDIALFRYGRASSHAGIVIPGGRVVHADSNVGCVIEAEITEHSALGSRVAGYWTLKGKD